MKASDNVPSTKSVRWHKRTKDDPRTWYASGDGVPKGMSVGVSRCYNRHGWLWSVDHGGGSTISSVPVGQKLARARGLAFARWVEAGRSLDVERSVQEVLDE